MYDITNRCEDKTYPPKVFHGRVTRYRLDPLIPPTLEMMREFCEDVDKWLSRDRENVAVVHCQSGKVSLHQSTERLIWHKIITV